MAKPDVIEVLIIMMLKDHASKLYDAIDQRVTAIYDEYGEGRFDYKIDYEDSDIGEFAQELKEKGDYFMFEIVDNVNKLASGDTIFKSASVKPIAFSSRSLKRKPKSL